MIPTGMNLAARKAGLPEEHVIELATVRNTIMGPLKRPACQAAPWASPPGSPLARWRRFWGVGQTPWFLFRVTLRRLDLAAEIYHLREPQKIPQVISPDEARRLLAVADGTR